MPRIPPEPPTPSHTPKAFPPPIWSRDSIDNHINYVEQMIIDVSEFLLEGTTWSSSIEPLIALNDLLITDVMRLRRHIKCLYNLIPDPKENQK